MDMLYQTTLRLTHLPQPLALSPDGSMSKGCPFFAGVKVMKDQSFEIDPLGDRISEHSLVSFTIGIKHSQDLALALCVSSRTNKSPNPRTEAFC